MTAPHSPVVPPTLARAIDAGITLRPSTATRRSSSSAVSTAASSRAARQRSTSAIASASTVESTRRIAPWPPSGDGSVSVKRLTPTTICSPEPMRRVRSAIDATSRDFERVDCGEGAAHGEHLVQLGLRGVAQLGGLRLHDLGSVEQVLVLQKVALVRQHLLHPQRPLLVPGSGQPECLVPRRQLDAARAGPLRQRHRQHLQHDALDVVLRLRLGEAEAVDLHAVAEAAILRVLDAVALATDRSHSSVNARSLHSSSTNRMPALTKNEIDANTRPKRSGSTCPESRTASSTPIAVANAYAISCTGVAPASCRWYEQTLIGFQAGACSAHQAIMSTIRRRDGSGGKM